MAVQCLILLQIILLLLAPIKASRLLCPKECGDFLVEYPFGIGEGCYFDKSFEVICNNSSGSRKAILKSNKLELSSLVSFPSPYNFINISAISLKSSKSRRNTEGVNLSDSPLFFSQRLNKFAAVGCNNFSMINNLRNKDLTNFGGCFSICTCDPNQSQNDGCCDILCTIPPNSKVFNANTATNYSPSIPRECTSASIVRRDWLFPKYHGNSSVLRDEEKVSAVLEWGTYIGECYEGFNSANKSCNSDNYCLIQLGSGYICLCQDSRSNSTQDICCDIAIRISSVAG